MKLLLIKHTTGYYWLQMGTKLTSAHLRSGKRKPLFNETHWWLLPVTTLWSAHIRSGKLKPLLMKHTTGYCWLLLVTKLRYFWLLLVTTGYYIEICTYKVWKTQGITLRSAHIRSVKWKPLFHETDFWFILVTTGKRKPLWNKIFYLLLLVTILPGCLLIT